MSAEEIRRDYDAFIRTLKDKAPKVDPILIIRSCILARRYPSENNQSFYIDIHLEKDADATKKQAELFHRTGTNAANHGNNHLKMTLISSLDAILSLANDMEIERIEGEVYPFA